MRIKFAQLLGLLLLTAWLAAGCATSTGFTVSGETLDAAGKSFVVVGQTYNRELDAKRITPEVYAKWAVFAKKFQQSYAPAVQLWKSSVAVNDAALTKQTNAIVTSLVSELAQLGAVVGVQVVK